MEDDRIVQFNQGLEEQEYYKLNVIDLKGTANTVAEIERESAKLQTELNIEQGPLIRLAIYHTNTGDYLLFIILMKFPLRKLAAITHCQRRKDVCLSLNN